MTAYRSGVPLRRDRGLSEFNGAPPDVLARVKQNLAALMGGGGLKTCDRTLTADEIRGMFANPVELVPAAPAGHSHVIQGHVLLRYIFATPAFTGGGVVSIEYPFSAVTACSTVPAAAIQSGGTEVLLGPNPPPTAIAYLSRGDGLVIKNATAAFAGGNGTIRVVFNYVTV